MKKIIKRASKCGFITLFLFFAVCPDVSWGEITPVRVGVLAKRGTVACIDKWTLTAEYLTAKIPDKTFEIIPLDSNGILSFVEFEKIDFAITNPSIYVELEKWHSVKRIATLKNKRLDVSYTEFGGVIFCKKNRKDIRSLTDLNRKTFMAVKETSFGGWQTAWRELKEAGVNPFSDFSSISFGGTHDTVVYAVRDGKVDAGTVRTDTLERMEDEGKIRLNDFHVIHEHGGREVHFPFLHSTRSYPEWTFAELKHTSDEMAKKVAVALFEMPVDSPAAIAAKCAGWTIPLNYQSVHECLEELRVGPYKDYGKITLAAVVKKYWAFMLAIFILFAAVLGAAVFISILNRNIKKTHLEFITEAEERKNAEEALQENEKKLRTIIEYSNQLFYLHDTEHVLSYISPTSKVLLEYTPEEIMIKWTELATDNPINQKGVEITEKAIKTGEKQKPYLLELKKKDHTLALFQVNESPVKDANGKVVGISGALTDVTEQTQAAEEKKKLEDQLQQSRKMETIGILAGGVAHDLNNILSGIISYPELLLLDLPEDSPLRKPLLTIQNSGEKAAVVVQDLLTLARRGVITEEIVNLNSITSEQLKSPEYDKLKSFHLNVDIKTSLEKDLLNIKGSTAHLGKTVFNLISNAAEAMPDGGKVFISTENLYIDRLIKGYDHVAEGDYVTVTVIDTGIGISEEDLKRIFEPFYTKKVMGRSGSGLGMSVVWGTVKDHNGYIDVESTEGKGTTFTLYFPVTREELPMDEPHPLIEDYIGNGESILVIDDVKEQREIASGMLKKLGYSVTSVSNGEEAIEYMKDNSADLLVLDMIMDPGIDGLETYKEILKLHPKQKAVIASGFTETDRVKEAKKLGAGQYIKKPYILEKIGLAVRNELEK